jgi:hypothetical protein
MKLGVIARDKISGFKGTVTGKASYLTGCDTYLLQPELVNGSFVEGRWFDEARLIEEGAGISASEVTGDKNGADIPAPIK